ncbi:MAG: hypothetical protein ABFS46_21915 [Myxococcota bacterium]
MSWEAFGALGEVVGGIAAVILLAYIAYQIRQNSRMLEQNARATQAATYQANGEFWARAWALLAQDPSLARIWRLGRDGEELDDDEIVRFESLLNVMFASLDDAYSQATLGTYDVDILKLGGSAIAELLSSPLALRWWQRDRHRFYRPEFHSAVEHLLGDTTYPARLSQPQAGTD